MESKIRALIVPLCERLSNHLTLALQAAKAEQLTLLALEVLIAKLLAEFACDLLAGLPNLLFDARRQTLVACPQCQQPMPVQGAASRTLISLFGRFCLRRTFY